jgi:hypothetical protein
LVRRALTRKVLLLAVLAALAGAPAAWSEASTIELMPGVTYTREVKSIRGKQVVLHVVVAPRPGGLYRLVPVLSNGTITGKETVSAMERRLSDGATSVGVNGDLFNWEQGYPSGIFMRDGVLDGRPQSGRSSLGIGQDGVLRMARISFFGTWGIADAAREALTQLNRPLDEPGAGLFTPAWGAETPRARNAVDVVVSGFPQASANADLGGQIVDVHEGGGTPIPPDGAVLQAVGPLGRQLSSIAQPGLPLVARLILKPWWDGVADAIGGGPALVRNGRIALPTTEAFTSDQVLPRHPRTAVGQRADGRIVLVAVDGRQSFSAGVNLWDLARELKRLGVVTGMAFDAGGSTTVAFDGKVLNSPSDGSERAVSTALMMLYYGAYAAVPANPVVSPNGDGVAEGQKLAYKIVRPSTVRARLIGPGGKVVWKEQGPKDPGTYPVVPDPTTLREGSWRFVVTAVDADGNQSEAARRFSVNETLGFLDLSRERLKVTAKRGGRLAISFRLARTARVVVSVEDRFGRVLRSLYTRRGHGRGRVELTWNARTDRGAVVASGRYLVHVLAVNRIGTAELTGAVVVRRAGPSR